MYYFEEEIARATREAGLRGVLGQTIIQFPVPDAKTPAEGLARAEAFIKEFAADDLITPAVAPHAMYTLDAQDAEGGAGAGRPRARAGHHPPGGDAGRGEDRAREVQDDARPAFLESIGFWGPRTLAAHARLGHARRHPDPGAPPRRRLAQPREQHEAGERHRAGARRCARPAWRSASAPTAPPATTTWTCSRRCGRRRSCTSWSTRDPRAIPAPTALRMATIDGARALGMDKTIGSLEPGKRADLIVVSMASARQTPMYDPLSHLVYVTRGDDVRTTIVNGKILMRDRKVLTLDEAAVLAEARGPGRAKVRDAVGRHDSTDTGLEARRTPRPTWTSSSTRRRIQARIRELAARDRGATTRRRGDPPGLRAQGRLHVHGGSGARDGPARHDGLHRRVELRQGHQVVRRGADAEGPRLAASKGATSSSSRTSWTPG